MMLLLFGYALSLDVDRIPTMIYDQDQTRRKPRADPPVPGLAVSSRSAACVERLRARSNAASTAADILMGVVIPRDYSQELGAGREAQVQLLIDGSDSNTASIALGYAESLVRSYSLRLRTRGAEPPRRRASRAAGGRALRVWYNSSLESKNYVVPGLIAVILQIIAALLTSLTIAREWEMGTMEQLLSTPLRPAELVLGKMLAYFVVGVVGCGHRGAGGRVRVRRAVARQLARCWRCPPACSCSARCSGGSSFRRWRRRSCRPTRWEC